MDDLISREALLEYIRSEEGAEKLKHSTVEAITLIGIIKSIPSVDAVPAAKLKAVANIALELTNKYEESACNLIWDTSTSPAEDENETHIECHKYRHRIKLFAGMKGEQNA